MGALVFNNQIFDNWLTRKSDEILSKVNKEAITNEEMLILILKAQTNHFHHMDDEFRAEFKEVKNEFKEVKEEFKEVRREFRTVFMWQTGLLIALFSGLYLKLYLN